MICRIHTLLRSIFIFVDACGFVNAGCRLSEGRAKARPYIERFAMVNSAVAETQRLPAAVGCPASIDCERVTGDEAAFLRVG